MNLGIRTLLTFILLFFFFLNFSFSQENEPSETELEEKNRIGFVVEGTFVPEGSSSEPCEECNGESKGYVVPTIGLEYTRTLSHNWDIGLSAELELNKYRIQDKDLNRHNPAILVAFVLYRLVDSWFIFWGAGMEFEKHKSLGVFRLGTEYEFALGDSWDITPAFTFDHKIDLNSFGLGISIGTRF